MPSLASASNDRRGVAHLGQSCLLTLSLPGETEAFPRGGTEPIAIGDGVKPAHADDWLIGCAETMVVPEARWFMPGRVNKGGELHVRDGMYGDRECAYVDAMRWALVAAASAVPHHELARRDEDCMRLQRTVRGHEEILT